VTTIPLKLNISKTVRDRRSVQIDHLYGEPIFIKFCMPFRVPDVFLSFEFQKDRMKNVGAVGGGGGGGGGRNFAPLIEKAHRLYNSLLLPHKP